MAKKRKRVPEILWRLFHNRARSLADTILALVPPVAEGCLCKQRRRCLRCSGDQAASFLLRPDDPSDYRRLLVKCFTVVSENAPLFTAYDPHCRWSQPEIVKRCIEMILYEDPLSLNLICSGYDRENRSSASVDMLTSSPWIFLLRRIGDALMMYLLKHTSLFLPLPGNKHYQVAGCPVSDLCVEYWRHCSDGLRNGKKGVGCTSEKQLRVCSVDFQCSSSSRSSVGINYNGWDGSLYLLPKKNEVSETLKDDAVFAGSSCALSKNFSLKKCAGNLEQNAVPSRKRMRPFRWQRQKKRRQLASESTISSVSFRKNCSDIDILSGELQNESSASSGQTHEPNTSPCVCCLVFAKLPMVKKNAEIDRRHMFYKLDNSTLTFPRKHILSMLKPNDSGAVLLFNNIFGTFGNDRNPQLMPCFHSNSTSSVTSTCLYHSLIKLLKALIRKAQNCQYLKLLDKHCPVTPSLQGTQKGAAPILEKIDGGTSSPNRGCEIASIEGKMFNATANPKNGKMTSEGFVDQLVPSKSYCPKKQVVSFIWAACRSIVPSPLLGTPANWRILSKNISKFIHLRKFEKFSKKECMQNLKLSQIHLFSSRYCGYMHENCCELGITDVARHVILERWVFWFFVHFVSPLVQANFYITETEQEKQNVSYYRKSTWKKLMGEAEKCLLDQRFRQLNHVSLRNILRNRSFGFSRARLCPKQIGFRLLANLQAPSRVPVSRPRPRVHSNHQLQKKAFYSPREVKYNFFKSVNNVLHDLHVVLKGIRVKDPEKLGSSVFDYNDVYKKLVPFLLFLKKRYTSMPAVFMVVSDVSKAFDSVNLEKLLRVMDDVIVDDEYTLQKFVQVIHTKKLLKVHQQVTLAPKDMLFESTGLTSQLPAYPVDTILVQKSLCRKVQKEEFNVILREHITRNVVQLGNNFYLQCIGIPQGSVLSTLLCSFYYGHMERNIIFPFLEKAGEEFSVKQATQCLSAVDGYHPEEMQAHASKFLLLRFVDDFLFLSPSKKLASLFFSRLERGVRGYNCCMNKEKYGLNFNINNEQGCQSNRLHVGKDGISFLRWSGLLVNCCTLEIQADYTRYLNSHLSATLTVSRSGKVGCQLKAKLCNYLRPKCHPIFYDSNINSPGIVRLNIYQVFLLSAMKFVCYVTNLSSLPRFSPNFYRNAIDASLRYMNRLVKRRMYSIEAGIATRPKYDVKKQEILWLGLYAYYWVLKKKQSKYKELLRLLRSDLKAYGKEDEMSSELKYAVDDSHSSVLWSIRY